jgi:hypothetical protein
MATTTGQFPAETGADGAFVRQRYLVGGQLTEPDVRLFTTLARFDAVYTATSSATCAGWWTTPACGATPATCTSAPVSARR